MLSKGRIAFINLSRDEVIFKDVPENLTNLFLGGRGFAMALLYNRMAPGVDPLGADNLLLVSTGLLTGTPAPSSPCTYLAAKSPLTGLAGISAMGGFFGAELRFAGFDLLVISGKAQKPVYLLIHNGRVEVKKASHIWGRDCFEAQTLIREELDNDEVKIMTIGPAGENLVRFANIRTGMVDSAEGAGLGAVMGSKNLKAVAARGTTPLPLADPEGILRYQKTRIEFMTSAQFDPAASRSKVTTTHPLSDFTAFAIGCTPKNDGISSPKENAWHRMETFSKGLTACFGCAAPCRHKYILLKGPRRGQYAEGPAYGTLAAFYQGAGSKAFHEALEGNYLVNKQGMDAFETGQIITWAFDMAERGLLSPTLLKGRHLTRGNREDVLELINELALRRGLGDLLADGPRRALRRLGLAPAPSPAYVESTGSLYSDARLTPVLALWLSTAQRGANVFKGDPDNHLSPPERKFLERLCIRAGMGVNGAEDDGPEKIIEKEYIYAVIDALGICKFYKPFQIAGKQQWKACSQLIQMITGLSFNTGSLMETGERVLNMERLFNIREGVSKKDDLLPIDQLIETQSSAALLECLERNEKAFMEKVNEYYMAHGWDKEGKPTPETLSRLGLNTENIDIV